MVDVLEINMRSLKNTSLIGELQEENKRLRHSIVKIKQKIEENLNRARDNEYCGWKNRNEIDNNAKDMLHVECKIQDLEKEIQELKDN